MEPLFEMCSFLLLVSKSYLIVIFLLQYLSSEEYAVKVFFSKLVVDNSGMKGFDFFFRKGNQCITCIKFLRSSYVYLLFN